jgi:hypothetical protein
MAIMHIPLCDFGRLGQAFRETDPASCGFDEVVNDIRTGQINVCLQVLAIDPDEGTCKDVSEDVARALLTHHPESICRNAKEFAEAQGIEIPDEDDELPPRLEHALTAFDLGVGRHL